MELTLAQNTFAVRLYEWSQRDFIRELQEGCPVLSLASANNRIVAAFVSWTYTLSSAERKCLAISLTRLCHENAVTLKGEIVTDTDRLWQHRVYEGITAYEQAMPPHPKAEGVDPEYKPLDKDAVIPLLARSVGDRLGRARKLGSKLVCNKEVGDWSLETEFCFRRKDSALSFEYQFIRRDGGRVKNPHPAQGPFPRTLFFFYGLATTFVYIWAEGEAEPATSAISKLATYFPPWAPALFDGLGMND